MTTCMYNTENKENATIGGHAITDEMCVNYMHYYPAAELEVCKSAVSNSALENYFKFEKRSVLYQAKQKYVIHIQCVTDMLVVGEPTMPNGELLERLEHLLGFFVPFR